MSKYQIFSLFCFIIGAIFFGYGFLKGDVSGGVFLIFPFVSGSGIYAFLGLIFIFFGIIFFMFGFTRKKLEDERCIEEKPLNVEKSKIKGGWVVLIGPIPIVFGSNWKIALILMIIAIILIVVSYFLLKF